MSNPTLEERLAGYLTAPEVAKKLGLSYRQLHYWLTKGILPQPTVTRKDRVRLFAPEWVGEARQVTQRLVNSRRDEIVELGKSGLSYAAIGRRLGISRERVRQILKGKPAPQKVALQSKVMLTVGDVASLLGVHTNTVRCWSNSGILKAYRVGPRGDRRFRREDIDSFLTGEKAVNLPETSE